jgi:DNA polymerase I-like protein with 3'-5' exonuclease and polymerase domains
MATMEPVAHLAKTVMEAAAELSVPLTVEASWGPNWNNQTDLVLD